MRPGMAAKSKAKRIDLKGVWELVSRHRNLKKAMDGLFQSILKAQWVQRENMTPIPHLVKVWS